MYQINKRIMILSAIMIIIGLVSVFFAFTKLRFKPLIYIQPGVKGNFPHMKKTHFKNQK